MPDPTSENGVTLAERLLMEARDSHLSVSVYLVNGFQLKGEIVDFDREAILFRHKNVHQVVMRSGVATMYPLPDSKHGANEWWRTGARPRSGDNT